RHTRFSRDWSSDVCSSDLTSHPSKNNGYTISYSGMHCRKTNITDTITSTTTAPHEYATYLCTYSKTRSNSTDHTSTPNIPSANRSEERRVGKECKSRRTSQ